MDNSRIAVSGSSKQLAVTELIYIDKDSGKAKILSEIRNSFPAMLGKNDVI